MSFNIYNDAYAVNNKIDSWVDTYKNTSLNQYHDRSELNLILPDDCLVVIGPPRLTYVETASLFVVGFLNSLQFTETRQVQPLKTIGSRRHIFAATNSPVQGSINRLLFVGDNIFKALHSMQDVPNGVRANSNNTFNAGLIYNEGDDEGIWFTNAEEDLYRIPFGLGIVYNSPSSMHGGSESHSTADYIEGCTITNRAMAIQSGQAMLMEQVSFMADRVVGWTSWSGSEFNKGALH